MDVTKAEVRTRSEALGMAKDCSGQAKRRKVGCAELASSSSSLTHEHIDFCEFPQASISQGDGIAAANESRCSNFSSDGGASCCSSNVSAEAAPHHKLRFTDLEESVAIKAISSTKCSSSQSGETTLSNQQAGKTIQPESTSVISFLREITTQKFTASAAEIEEFFAVAEKNLRKQFIDKYNYDISKDEPLAGRYEWVPLKP